MLSFQDAGLPEQLLASLEKMNFTTPTPIQMQAIPPAMEGRDILGSAQTGTGKTGAFGIPLVAKLLTTSRGSALILLPTRELAMQVLDALQQMIGKSKSISTALLIGGEPMPKQLQQLRARPRLIVGTPGRINDHLTRGSLMLHDTSFLVLDETDRMLDMGFGIQLDAIAKFLTAKRQTLMFSATMPPEIVKLSKKYMTDPDPVRITVGSTTKPSVNIKQEIVHTSDTDKYEHLITQLKQRDGSIIIFVKTKRGAAKIAERLNRAGHSADTIHGDLRQSKRNSVIAAFRSKKYRILVATDVAARGLDIPHIEHVINYDLPQCPEDYIHRIGRTARAGAEGSAICLISPEDNSKWRAIHRMLNPGEKLEGMPDAPAGKSRNGRRPGGRPQGRSFGGGGKPAYGKSSDGGKPAGDKPSYGRRSDGDKPAYAKASDGSKPAGDRPSYSKRTDGGKPSGDRPSYGRPSEGGKPAGAKPFNARRRSGGQRPGGPTAKVA